MEPFFVSRSKLYLDGSSHFRYMKVNSTPLPPVNKFAFLNMDWDNSDTPYNVKWIQVQISALNDVFTIYRRF